MNWHILATRQVHVHKLIDCMNTISGSGVLESIRQL